MGFTSTVASRVVYDQIPYQMIKSRLFLSVAYFLGAAFHLLAQSSSQNAAVLLSATVQSAPASITIQWAASSNTSSISIYRKLKTDTSWGGSIANPSASSTQYQDNSVQVGVAYEYKVVRSANGVSGTGYIATGIEVPLPDYRGKLILLVDNTLAPQMVTELSQLQQDLKADGWAVIREDVSRTAPASSIRSIVMGHYNSDPSNVKAVYVVGHVPVPYSGNAAPDGHSEHVGAWPCDGYYGEMTGSWTDNSVNNNGAARQANRNVPGDGKFDHSNFPSDLELQVGRVDMYDMPAFSQGEVQLLKNYLNRAHSFKIKGWSPLVRGLMFDNLQWVSNPIAGSGWRNMGPLVGASNITNANQNGTSFHNLVNGESYMWTYSSAGGIMTWEDGGYTYNGASNVGTTQNYASNSSMGGVFNMSCGSYFGDWDNKNNFLRAPIAKGDALTSVWAGIPAWYFHHMGLGDNIGYSTLATMNNSGMYTPLTEGWQGSIGRIHLGLMGDPSLRMEMVAPPSSLTVSNANGTASFNWSASPESNLLGYHIYRFSSSGTITRLTSSPVTGTSYQNSAIPFEAGREYMVRAVKLKVNQSGSYLNQSLGALATAAGSASADCNGVVGGGAVSGSSCNDNNPCTINDTWNSSCQCVGTPVTVSASITPAGSTSFCSGGSVVLNANTGSGLSYQWRRDGNSISGANSASYTATQAGVYTVRVNNGSCESTSSGVTITITSGPSASVTAVGSTNFCSGGSVQLNANTGSGYSYQWRRNGTSISGANSSSYTATEAGDYAIRITSGGCETTSSTVNVTVNSVPTASITAEGSTSFCSGGSVVLNANSGSGLNYQWRRDGSSISGANSASYTATEAGVYTVRVSNGGCETTSSGTTVSVGSGPSATITPAGPTSFCSGGSVLLQGNAGSGYSYQWRKDGSSISGANSVNYTAAEAGVYTLRVTNGGCQTTSSGVTVSISSTPSAQITPAGSTTFCAGGSVVLNANSGSGLSYQWRRDGSSISGANAASYTATEAGSYTVRVSNNGCETTSSGVTVSISSAPSASITPAGPTSFCSGGSVQLNANTGSGLSYQWRRDGSSISGANSASYSATQAGVYTVRVNNGGCESTSSGVTVSITSVPSAAITANGPTSFCTGGSVVLNANGGSGLTYVWRRDGNAISGATSASYTATQAGVYTVRITNGGCESTSSGVSVSVSPTPSASITSSGGTDFCSGGSVVLNANTGSGLSYVWRRDGSAISGATSSSYTATISGDYTVVVSNGSCSATSAAMEVNVTNGPVAAITPQGSLNFCEGGSVVLSATSGSGLSYAWQRNGQNINGGIASSFTATQAGSYTVIVSGNGCSATSPAVTVSTYVPDAPVLSLSGPESLCAGDFLDIYTEPIAGATYAWSFNGSAIANSDQELITVSEPGTYSLQIMTDGCVSQVAQTVVTLVELPVIEIAADGPTSVCVGDTVDLIATYDPSYSYVWIYNGQQMSNANDTIFNATASGQYTVFISNGQCSNVATPIMVNMAPDVEVFTSGTTSICEGESVSITAVADSTYTYTWSLDGAVIAGETAATINAGNSGSYMVTIDNSACSASSEPVEVLVSEVPVASINAAGPLTFCAGDNVELSAVANEEWSYQWMHDGENIEGATSAIFSAQVTGAYAVAVTNGGCTIISDPVVVTTLPIVSLELDGPASFCNGDSVTISAFADTSYSYTWSFNGNVIDGATASSISAGVAGEYQVSITDGICNATSGTIVVATNEEPVFELEALGATSFCAGDSVLLTIVPEDGSIYDITWSLNDSLIENAIGNSLFASVAGNYSASVSNNGCVVTSSQELVTTLPVVALSVQGNTSFCEGGNVVLYTTFDSAYTYQWMLEGEVVTDGTTHELFVNTSGIYSVQVAGAGCTAVSDTISLEVTSAPELNCFANAAEGYVGVEVLNGTGPYTYMWNGDASLDTTILAVEGAGIHVVSVTDANGCTESCTIQIGMETEDSCIGLRTETQQDWATSTLLANGFDAAFPNDLTIGCGFRMLTLTSAEAVAQFLPSQGPSQRLPFGTLVDPGSTYGNSLAGELIALKLAVRFDELNASFSSSSTLLQDAVVASGTFEGLTVAEVIEQADLKIGGCFSWFSRNQLRMAIASINTGYAGGTITNGYLNCTELGEMPEPVEAEQLDDAVKQEATAYPNPFNEYTTITLPRSDEMEHVTIDILSADGVVLERIFDGTIQPGGDTRVEWHASTRAKGVYFYRVSSKERAYTGRVVLQ